MGHLTLLIVLHTVFPFLYAQFPVRGDINDICYFLDTRLWHLVDIEISFNITITSKKSGADLSF